MKKVKKAFSLIEVIFVLVILGIVASISSQIIVQVYDSYITQKAIYNVSTKTELVANQIVNRLTYSIQGSRLARDDNNYSNWKQLKSLNLVVDKNLTILEWIGYDNDSFSAGKTPYWSGVANYATATKSSIETPGSNLSEVDTIIKNISNNKVGLTLSPNRPAIIFSPKTGSDPDTITPECMGMIDNNTSCIFRVSKNDNTTFSLDENKTVTVTERYQLAWSAYALVPIANNNSLYDLFLHYNYQPWNGESYKNGDKSLLMTNVSVFKFTENGGVIQFKLCASENIGQDYNISTCKEKVIIR